MLKGPNICLDIHWPRIQILTKLGILLFFVLLILNFFLWFPLLESSVLPEEDHFWPYDIINGKLKIGHSNSSLDIKYLRILQFFILLILTFFLPFPLLESSVLLPEEDHFMPEPMVCSTAYNPYQYKQAPPTHVILNVVDIIIAKISKNNSRFGSCIHYFLLSTSLKSTYLLYVVLNCVGIMDYYAILIRHFFLLVFFFTIWEKNKR